MRPPVARQQAGGARVAASAGRAFTLIELLVVMAIIAIFAGLMSSALKNGGTGTLTSAQGTVAGLINIARSQAALNQTKARLIIYATKSADETRYLHHVQVVVPEPGSTTNWITKGDIVDLPAGVYFVPPIPPALPVEASETTTWPVTRCSTNLTSGTMQVDSAPGTATYFYIEFTLLGTLNGAAKSGFILTLATGKSHLPGDSTDTEPVRFSKPDDVKGLKISQYGAMTFLTDATDFQ